MEKNGTPWNNYSKTSSVYITGETKHYSYPFKMNDPTDLQARFVVNAGKSDINFSIDNISVREAVTTHSESSEPLDQAELVISIVNDKAWVNTCSLAIPTEDTGTNGMKGT